MKEHSHTKEFYEYWSQFVRNGTSSRLSALEQTSIKIFYDWLKDNYVIVSK